LPILFQKSIGNGIANTFVPRILPIIFGNTFTFLWQNMLKLCVRVCTALDVLQGDKVVGLGYHVPTLTVVKNRLKECSQTLTVCKPLAVALQTAVNTRFSEMTEDLNAQLAAVVNPVFKLD